MKIGIIGTGSWGTALAQVLVDNEHDVIMWGRDTNEVKDLNRGFNKKYFNDLELPIIKATNDINDFDQDLEMLVLATPSSAIEEIIEFVNKNFENELYIVNVAKGFHMESNQRLSTILKDKLSPKITKAVVSLIGPSHAEEVILRMETLITAVSSDLEAAEIVQKVFSNSYFRVYTSTDEVSAEIGAGVKNVIALASGIVAGLGLGDNSKAALITRGLAEMARLGLAMGGNHETFLGLTGVGDLIVTAMSEHSRNYQAGYAIGKENSAEKFLAENKTTVEGIRAAKVVKNLAKEYQVSMPISENVYEIIYHNKQPLEALDALMSRSLKSEDIS